MTATSHELLQRAQIVLLRESIEYQKEDEAKEKALVFSSGLVDYLRGLNGHFENAFYANEKVDELLRIAVELWHVTHARGKPGPYLEAARARLERAVEVAIGAMS